MLGPSASEARSRARLVSDLLPGSETVACDGGVRPRGRPEVARAGHRGLLPAQLRFALASFASRRADLDSWLASRRPARAAERVR